MYFRTEIKVLIFFFNDTATTEIYTLSLHDALPIYIVLHGPAVWNTFVLCAGLLLATLIVNPLCAYALSRLDRKSTTSELQSRQYLVCRLLLEKKTTLLHTTSQYAYGRSTYTTLTFP